jgi:SAM-dependent methyltransferase
MLFHARVLAPSGIARLYDEWIDATQIEHFETDPDLHPVTRTELARQTFKHLLALHALAGAPRTLRLLDFGCGDGRALDLATALGFEAWGVDCSATRAARTRRFGPRVHASLDEVRAAGGGNFDAVLLTQVLEHLVSPRAVLTELVGMLRVCGAMFVEVPDARGIHGPPRSFQQFRTVQPLEHLNAFTPATLRRICTSVGLIPARLVPAHAGASFSHVLRSALKLALSGSTTGQYFVRSRAGVPKDERRA